jgi:hypothetical protein
LPPRSRGQLLLRGWLAYATASQAGGDDSAPLSEAGPAKQLRTQASPREPAAPVLRTCSFGAAGAAWRTRSCFLKARSCFLKGRSFQKPCEAVAYARRPAKQLRTQGLQKPERCACHRVPLVSEVLSEATTETLAWPAHPLWLFSIPSSTEVFPPPLALAMPN